MVDDVVVFYRGRLVVHTPIDDLLATAEPAAKVRTRQPEKFGATCRGCRRLGRAHLA